MEDSEQSRTITRRRRVTHQPESPLPRELMALPGETSPQEFEEQEPLEQTPEDRVFEMIQGFSGDSRATVRVSRQTKDNREEYCRTYTVAEFDAGGLDMIRNEWGPGSYIVKMYAPNPNNAGRVSMMARQHIGIAAPPTVNPLLPNPTGGGNQLDTLAQILADNQRQTQEMIAKLSENRPDPMAQMTQMFTMMKLMREATGMDSAPAKASPISEVIAAVRQLREISGELNPQPDEPDSMTSLVKLATPIVEKVMEAQNTPRATEVAPLPSIDVPASMRLENPIPSQPSQNQPNEEDMSMALKMASIYLIAMIKKNEPVEKMAEFVYEKLPDELLDMIELPHWWDVMVQVMPDFAPYQEKVTEIRNRVVEMLKEDDQDDSPEGGAAPTGS